MTLIGLTSNASTKEIIKKIIIFKLTIDSDLICYIIVNNKGIIVIIQIVEGVLNMSRIERRNMVKYIEQMRGIHRDDMLFMTDADIEHIYETTYFEEENAE